MTWLDARVDELHTGRSLNVVGLSLSGRTSSLELLSAEMVKFGWACVKWNLQDVATKSKQELHSSIAAIRQNASYSILVIDGFGDALLTAAGRALDTLLFQHITAPPAAGEGEFRCVVQTSPRDQEVPSDGSSVRDRLRRVPVAPASECGIVPSSFGFAQGSPPSECCGEGYGMLSERVTAADSQVGLFLAGVRTRAAQFVGELSEASDERLGRILATSSASWDDDLDPFLKPLVARVTGSNGVRAELSDARIADALRPLLLSSAWPDTVKLAAQRFAARCGNEPRPLWSDPYLLAADEARLKDFVAEAIRCRPQMESLRMLCADFANDKRFTTSEAAAWWRSVLADLGTDASRVEVRMITAGQDRTELHRRGLSLRRRNSFCSLPPVDRMLLNRPIGNEYDQSKRRHDPHAEAAWRRARCVFPLT